ncbi:hypothetical protein AVEN_22913-1 [Araneus ventricosus]|uniref:Uncharacterized protein n=1 Tax=Araneus ventricosus TaxID=182803 RepID=A0A4Y2D4W1_ARAVE|nr:hypothetical protein AVEN_22913-1 [Araneus ventricosus]
MFASPHYLIRWSRIAEQSGKKGFPSVDSIRRPFLPLGIPKGRTEDSMNSAHAFNPLRGAAAVFFSCPCPQSWLSTLIIYRHMYGKASGGGTNKKTRVK